MIVTALARVPECPDFFPILPIFKPEEKNEKFEKKLKILRNLASLLKKEFAKFSGRLLGEKHPAEIENFFENVKIQIGTPKIDEKLNEIFLKNLKFGENFVENFGFYFEFLSKLKLNETDWEFWDRITTMIDSPHFDESDFTIYFADLWLTDEFVDFDFPFAAISGKFFSVLAHEMTHALYAVRNFKISFQINFISNLFMR